MKNQSRTAPAVRCPLNPASSAGSRTAAGTTVSNRLDAIFSTVLPLYCALDVTVVFEPNVVFAPYTAIDHNSHVATRAPHVAVIHESSRHLFSRRGQTPIR